jgi:hypothetical protein
VPGRLANGSSCGTDPSRKFELMFRLYGPKPEFFDKKWALPDVEKID